ncbi:MAG TPA: hypothetical protein VEC06_07965 [Paucimonas sp.]|nr:hypothetical protein [Paucimonas sp.]
MALSNKARNLILAASLAIPAAAPAEDIDLFQGGSDITGNKPNVLIIIDNSANWARNDQGWEDGKQGESELNALKLVLSTLTSDVRVGLMMFTEGSGSSIDGGYLRFAIRDMSSTNRTGIQTILDGIKPNFNSPTEKVGSAKTKYSNALYETYRYFGSSTRYSNADDKRDYTGNGSYSVSPYTAGNLTGNAFTSSGSDQYVGPLSASAPCAKNFIIFIGNGFPSTDGPNPTTLGDPTLSTFNATQIYSSSKDNYADEWARYLKDTGVVAPCSGGTCADGKIVTFTIDVYKDHQDTDQTDLLKSMAKVGGGEYFAATSEQEIVTALTKIFNQIQAVNSVFTSASLPVSVNTQGTYLNQIYMGVFRPDGGGKPRWMGNLKQYKFGRTIVSGQSEIFLADADGNAAVSTTTGFIKPDARSYWTYSTSPSAGFWAFNPQGSGGQYDSPDGDLVEKGGAAQKLRALGPTDRTVYTCTPACTANSTPSAFATTNASLVSALTGTSSSVTLTRAGPTVTGTTATDLVLNSPTDTVTISGANVAEYNGTWTVTKGTGNTFTFTIVETPDTPATTSSAMTVSSGSSVSQTVSAGNMTYSNGVVTVHLPAHGFANNQSVTIAGADVSAAMSSATEKCTGWTSTATCEYNGTFTITKLDANNFTYSPPSTNFGKNITYTTTVTPPETFTTPLGTATISCKKGSGATTYNVNITSMTRVTGTGTKTVTAILDSGASMSDCDSTLTVGNGSGDVQSFSISSSAAENGINGTHTPISAGTTCASGQARAVCFNVTVTSTSTPSSTTTIVPASPATGTITATGIPTRTVTSITRTDGNASNIATVTVTTDGDHNFGSQSSVTIAGATQTEYNGTKTTSSNSLAFPTTNTITYTLTTGPTASATGTAAKGSTVEPNALINWVRGVDNKEDENVNGSLTDVRASIHGDVLHSRPVVINYGDSSYGVVAFYGSNDGTLRAVKAGQASSDGTEKWAFVAPEHYSTLSRLYTNSPVIKFPNTSMSISPTPTKRNYFFDGNIGVFQTADLATTHLYVAMRRGGRFLYAFDVSNPDAPKFLWKKGDTDTGYSELGQTWSEPKVAILKKTAGTACSATNAASYTRALIFGAGYDATEEDKDNQGTSGVVRSPTMGRGVFVVNASDGSVIKLLQPSDTKKYSFPADVTMLDTDNDGCIDRLYAVDTGANLFRMDIGDVDSDNWKVYKLARLGDVGDNGGSDDRKFLYAPDVALSYIAGQQTAFVAVGSGDREDPRSTAVANRFYVVKDTVATDTTPSSVTALVESDLTKVTDFNPNTTDITASVIAGSDFKGWRLEYESGEKSVNAPLIVAGVVYFGTNLPKEASNQCTPNLGTARGYAVNLLSGTSAYGDRNADGSYTVSDLYTNFVGGGLPPSPVSGAVKLDDGSIKRFIIGGGCGSTGSAIEGCEVEANPSSNRNRVYWYFKKDQ